MKKYIIKNCFYTRYSCTHSKELCSNNNDCLIKQTYEKVKNCQCAELMNNFEIEESENE